jgi:hypothetical protein
MSGFPTDILAAINDHTPGEGAPAAPSPDVTEKRGRKLTLEDVERLAAERERELAGDAEPEKPKPPTMTELFSLGMLPR